MGEMAQREAYGRALAEYGKVNPRVVVLDADTASSTFTSFFAKEFPERFYNIGIAEPCMVDVGVGLALGGMIPFVNAFAAFISLRALEQVRTCICYAKTNVKLAASYAGVSDFKDGPTHHAIKDLAIMRALPDMRIVVPADANEIRQWVPVIAEYDGPVYFRLNRAASLPVNDLNVEVEFGKGHTLRQGNDLTIIAIGTMVGYAVQAAEILAAKGIEVRVLNMASLKPMDTELVIQAAEETGAIITAEEHVITGGLGSAVAEILSENCPTLMKRIGIQDTFARTGMDPESIMNAYGLGVTDIVAASEEIFTRRKQNKYAIPG